jgi:ATP-dependent protease HslVU (ClpYQ) ATPase subunit
MTPSLNGWHGPFKLSYSASLLTDLQGLFARAKEVGLGEMFRAALAAILSRLKQSAREFGEALFDYKHVELQFRVGAIAPLAVQYAVHRQQPLVLLRQFVPLF